METTAAGQSRAMVLGSLTIPGRPEQVGLARAFVARALATSEAGADADAATLLTSEIVTNAIQHTRSGAEGGTVTIVVIGISRGILVEIIDDGAAGAPVVKGDLYAAEGHGLFLVEHLASEWGYQRDEAGTTVWFHLPASYEPRASGGRPDRPPGRARQISADFTAWNSYSYGQGQSTAGESRPGYTKVELRYLTVLSHDSIGRDRFALAADGRRGL